MIVDANPAPEQAPQDYFEKVEQQRKDKLLKQFEADEEALIKENQKKVVKEDKSNQVEGEVE